MKLFDSLDHNDTFDTGNSIQESVMVQGEIKPVGDFDFYKFTPTTSGLYRIGSTGDTFVGGQLYDDNRVRLASSNNWPNPNFLIEYLLIAGQNYFIKVSGTGAYGLLIIAEAGADLTATPLVQIGINPNHGDSAGLFVGIKDIRDTQGNVVPDSKLAGYQIEIYYNHNQVRVFNVVDEAYLGQFTLNNETTMDKISVTDAVYQGTSNFEKLFFVPLAITGNSSNSTNVIIKFINLNDPNWNHINIPDVTLTFQRGKIVNEASQNSPSTADAIAGLQYLAELRDLGFEHGKVNVINMSSILPPETGNISIKPSIKDVIALMQKLVGLRDDSFQLFSGS